MLVVRGPDDRGQVMTRSDDGSSDEPEAGGPPELDADEPDSVPAWEYVPVRPLRPQLVAGDIGLALRRVGAWIIDFTIAYSAVGIVVPLTTPVPTEATDIGFGVVVWVVAVPLVYRWAIQSAFGFTVGKWLPGLRLVDAEGRPPGPVVVLGREAMLVILVFPIILGLGSTLEGVPIVPALMAFGCLADVYLMFRRSDTRALHDLPVRTQVTRAVRVDAADTPRGGHGRFS